MASPIVLVAGARPNFMKLAPVEKALMKNMVQYLVVHTGQHYDDEMSSIFFEELGIELPEINLGVGSGTHAEQTAKIMLSFEKVCRDFSPSMVVVFGDVNSTIACSLVARKLSIPVAHVESGLRSLDQNMPEEINRILTDHISDMLFTTSNFANENLKKEGIPEEKVFFSGNVMIDTLYSNLEKIGQNNILEELNISSGEFDVVTLHRPSNVDNKDNFQSILEALNSENFDRKIVFPMHPRTKNSVERFDLQRLFDKERFVVSPPVGYHSFIKLISNCRSIWTDSGGIQEEASVLGIPCFTLRRNTERPITIELGTNKLVDPTFDSILLSSSELSELNFAHYSRRDIPLWDGNSSERIVKEIKHFLGK
jgi:UDP-N-acetylglucosamine 2-epimerase (non-hydrolysing)